MGKASWAPYVKKLLWVIGLIILASICFHFDNQIQQKANEQFNFIPVIWTKLFISLMFGLYLSLILVKRWSISINSSLLWCVAVPCLLLSISFPVLVTLEAAGHLPDVISSSPVIMELQKIFSTNILGVTAGLTMIISFFGNQKICDDNI